MSAKHQFNVYTMMMILATIFMFFACLFMFFEWWRHDWTPPPRVFFDNQQITSFWA
ncbi:MAG: hypothetical protein ABL921_17595 [Pirellula sp.]